MLGCGHRSGVFVICGQTLNEPFDRRGKCMCSGLVVQFHRNRDKRTALRCKLVVEVCKRFRRGARYGCDSAVGGLPKLCFKAADDCESELSSFDNSSLCLQTLRAPASGWLHHLVRLKTVTFREGL
jgi:hypothetical protein